MNEFGSGPRLDDPIGDSSRQAVAALRGYGYQLYTSALAWLALPDEALLYLEVAEDYAVATSQAVAGTQVRDTQASGGITLQSGWARQTIDSFVDLVLRNPGRIVSLHYLTTSPIGLERERAHRIDGGPALEYWRRAAAGASLAPLRALIEGLELQLATKTYLTSLSDTDFRQKFLQRLHWQCGAPGIAEVRADLEAGLIEYASSARHLSSQASRDLVPKVLEQVLLRTVSGGKRTLRRADLLSLIDDAALVAVPIEQLAAAFRGDTPTLAVARATLLMPVEDNPLPEIQAPRESLVAAIDNARREYGFSIVTGATGLGKSLAARLVTTKSNSSWSIADLRYLLPAATAERLERVNGELAARPQLNVILDDLNGLDDPPVADALARLLAGLRRRDCTAIVTTYRSPANTTLEKLAPRVGPPIQVPYLDEEEVRDLVVRMDGEENYASAVYLAAAKGHPQITFATLLHLKRAGWSRRTLAAILGGQLQTELSDERRAVRERMARALPDEAQTLLFRTSLVRNGFDRSLAIRIADLSPAIARGGLVLDQLVGPWIEPFGRGKLRISPMVEDAADDVLSAAECCAVHRCVAEATMMGEGGIDPSDAPTAMYHALRSGETDLVAGFAHSVLTCGYDMIDALAPFLVELIVLPFDKPIFAKDGAASAMMRLAQLMVLLPFGSADQAQACWETLEDESVAVKGELLFEGIALSKLLLHPRTGELFPDWPEILLRFDRLSLAEPRMSEASINFRSKAGGDPHVTGVLFAGQIRSFTTVAKFREVMERLGTVDGATRTRVLSSFSPGRGDISVLVNHGWMRESRNDGFDWETAQRDYGAVFELAMAWGDTMLASRCAIAQAMCIDEDGKDAERALALLAEAERRIGMDIALSRARAKIHWRRRDHAAALPLLTAAAEAGGQDFIEQAYIAREAGISAASLGDWDAAYKWFERAQEAATAASGLPTVRAMSIGLLADTAQAAFKAGQADIAITTMCDALTALPSIDADGTLPEAHCHRVVRHALLWLYCEITGLVLDDQEIHYWPGAASNPEPLEAIRSHPVAALDMAFYMLAEADEELPDPTGFYRDFRKHLVVGPVLSAEISAAIREDHKAIVGHDPANFVDRLRRHASMSKMIDSGEAREAAADLADPKRGTIPLATIDLDGPDDLYRPAEDFLLTFAIGAVLARAFEALDTVITQCLAAPEIVGLHPMLNRLIGDLTTLTSDRDGAAIAISTVRRDLSGRPLEFCWSAVWLLIHLSQSRLSDKVAQPMVAWIFAGADHAVRNARFRLVTPAVTVPQIEQIIDAPERDMSSAAKLLLALAPAVGTTFISQVLERLEQIAQPA